MKNLYKNKNLIIMLEDKFNILRINNFNLQVSKNDDDILNLMIYNSLLINDIIIIIKEKIMLLDIKNKEEYIVNDKIEHQIFNFSNSYKYCMDGIKNEKIDKLVSYKCYKKSLYYLLHLLYDYEKISKEKF
jgi:hypothetical protein